MNDSNIFVYGDVKGPAAATNNCFALWNGTTGKLLKNSSVGIPASGFVGDVVGPASSTNNMIALWNGTTGRLLKNSSTALPASAIVGTSDTQTLTGKSITIANNTAAWTGAANFQVSSNGASDTGSGAFMTFNRSGSFAANLGLDTNNTFKLAGYSLASVVPFQVTSTGVMTVWRTVCFNQQPSQTASTASTSVDFSNGSKQIVVLAANTTITMAFPGYGHYQILLQQNATGNFTVTWAAGNNPQYVGAASAPAINLPANTYTMVNVYSSGSAAWIAVSKVNAT